MPAPDLPLVYSCSGCSSAAQMANHLALRLDRLGEAEMSCIAGVGGGVAGLVRTARSGRRILALDGCVLHCVAACLSAAGVAADAHITLSTHGVRKRKHADFDPQHAEHLLQEVVRPAAAALRATGMPMRETNAALADEAAPPGGSPARATATAEAVARPER